MTQAKEPQRLASWVVRNGGLKDSDGFVKQIIGTTKTRPGLINSHGMDLDDAALRAWEDGYFPGQDRPFINDFLAAVDADLRVAPRYSTIDTNQVLEWRETRVAERDWSDDAADPAADILRRLVEIFRTHGEGGKRKAMRPILREAETFLRGVTA